MRVIFDRLEDTRDHEAGNVRTEAEYRPGVIFQENYTSCQENTEVPGCASTAILIMHETHISSPPQHLKIHLNS